MRSFGTDLDTKKIISEDGFYSSLSDFKRFLLFVLNQYLMEDNIYKMIYNSNTGEFINDKNYKSPYKKIVMDRIDLRKIGFCNAGFTYTEDDGELAIVSPEYFMIHFLECIKKSSSELYAAFLNYQKEYGNEVIDGLSFTKIHDDLYNKYRSKSKETKGLYKLTNDYSETYLRSILLLKQIETTIDNVSNELLDYFSDGFNEWDDEIYKKVEERIENKLNSNLRNDKEEIEDGNIVHYIDQDYLKLQDKMQELREKEAKNALNRYRKKFADNQKVSCFELIRILENQFKEIVVCYSYLRNEYKRGCITDLGIDEVLYYSHPRDKYDHKRLCDETIGYCTEDYDEIYSSSNDKENDDDSENVIRHIYL